MQSQIACTVSALLVLALSAAASAIAVDCGGSSAYLKVANVTVAPVIAGQPVVVTVAGTVSKDLPGGSTVYADLYSNYVLFFDMHTSVCSLVNPPCATLTAGQAFALQLSFKISRPASQSPITGKLYGSDTSHAYFVCANFDFVY